MSSAGKMLSVNIRRKRSTTPLADQPYKTTTSPPNIYSRDANYVPIVNSPEHACLDIKITKEHVKGVSSSKSKRTRLSSAKVRSKQDHIFIPGMTVMPYPS